jgi:hypothetical protein
MQQICKEYGEVCGEIRISPTEASGIFIRFYDLPFALVKFFTVHKISVVISVLYL